MEFLKFLLLSPPGSFATRDLSRDSRIETGRSGGPGRGWHRVYIQPSESLQSPGDWHLDNTPVLNTSEAVSILFTDLYKVGHEQEYKGMFLLSSNKQRETWKFGNHNMKMGSIFISSAGNNKSEMDCWVVTAQCALCSDSHAHICDWKMRRERFILDDDTMW